MIAGEKPVTFRSQPSLVVGWCGLALVAVLCVLGFTGGDLGDRMMSVGAFLFFRGVIWGTMIWPALVFKPDTLLLRNLLHSVELPWAAVDSIQVRSVTVVDAGDRRFLCPGFGRSRRQLVRADSGKETPPGKDNTADLVTELGSQRAEAARRDRPGDADERLLVDVHRQWAWSEIAVIVVGAALFVAGLLG